MIGRRPDDEGSHRSARPIDGMANKRNDFLGARSGADTAARQTFFVRPTSHL
jgi:hypothetical protein